MVQDVKKGYFNLVILGVLLLTLMYCGGVFVELNNNHAKFSTSLSYFTEVVGVSLDASVR
jgi:hypothetical protein